MPQTLLGSHITWSGEICIVGQCIIVRGLSLFQHNVILGLGVLKSGSREEKQRYLTDRWTLCHAETESVKFAK